MAAERDSLLVELGRLRPEAATAASLRDALLTEKAAHSREREALERRLADSQQRSEALAAELEEDRRRQAEGRVEGERRRQDYAAHDPDTAARAAPPEPVPAAELPKEQAKQEPPVAAAAAAPGAPSKQPEPGPSSAPITVPALAEPRPSKEGEAASAATASFPRSAVVLSDFVGEAGSDELTVTAGTRVTVLRENGGWLVAYTPAGGAQKPGLLPPDFVVYDDDLPASMSAPVPVPSSELLPTAAAVAVAAALPIPAHALGLPSPSPAPASSSKTAAAPTPAAAPAPAAAPKATLGTGVLLSDFVGETVEELSVAEGTRVTVESEVDGWLLAHTADGKSGLVPRDYVQLATPAPAAAAEPPPAAAAKPEAARAEPAAAPAAAAPTPAAEPAPAVPAPAAAAKTTLGPGILLADFVGETAEELSVAEGTRVDVDYEADGWLFAHTAGGKAGLVPRDYVQLGAPAAPAAVAEPLPVAAKPEAGGAEPAAVPAPAAPTPAAAPAPAAAPKATLGTGVLIADFAGETAEELSVSEGTRVTVESEVDGWLLAHTADGMSGLVPKAYVLLADAAVAPAASRSGEVGAAATALTPEAAHVATFVDAPAPPPLGPVVAAPPAPAAAAAAKPATPLGTGVLRADFTAESSEELTVAAGTVVTAEYEAEGWLFVRGPDGKAGLVPREFVELGAAAADAPSSSSPSRPLAAAEREVPSARESPAASTTSASGAPEAPPPRKGLGRGVLQADFAGETSEELTVAAGTHVFVEYEVDGWYYAHTSDANGAASGGLVPKDYIALLDDGPAAAGGRARAAPVPRPAAVDPKRAVQTGIMQVDFEAETAEELSVALGTRVMVDYEVDGWLFVHTSDGRKGLVPKDFVTTSQKLMPFGSFQSISE